MEVHQTDVLSEVLKAVKLDGAVFFNGEFSSPWCTREPDSHTMASYLPSHPKHVFIFHLVTEGKGYVPLCANMSGTRCLSSIRVAGGEEHPS